MHVVLQLGDFEVPVEITDRTSLISPHTGARLVQLKGFVTTRDGAAQERLLQLVDAVRDQPVVQVVPGEEGAQQWRIHRLMHSSSSGGGEGPRYTVTLQLEQYERREPDQLVIGELATTPFAYKEVLRADGRLEIEAKVALNEADTAVLRAMLKANEAVNVRRTGLDDEPRRMLFHDWLWARNDGPEGDRLTRFDLELAEEGLPDAGRPVPFFVAANSAHRHLAYRIALIEELLSRLVDKGTITAADLEAMRNEAEGKAFDRLFAFYRVRDISA